MATGNKQATPAPAPAATPDAGSNTAGPAKGTFLLNPAELASLTSARGRKATDSEYLEQVKAAQAFPTTFNKDGGIVTGDVHGIAVTATKKASWIGPQLRKAAKQLGIDPKYFTVLDRSTSVSESHPMGFVAYWVKPIVKDEPTDAVVENATESA